DVAGLGAAVTAEELEFENDGGTITLTAEIGNTDKNVTLSRDDEGVWSCYTDADKDSSIWNSLPERCQYEVPS
uniref:pilin n=1 Tax=Marinospirillum sp. TaxID=2183934 RepID=UPI003A8547D3